MQKVICKLDILHAIVPLAKLIPYLETQIYLLSLTSSFKRCIFHSPAPLLSYKPRKQNERVIDWRNSVGWKFTWIQIPEIASTEEGFQRT